MSRGRPSRKKREAARSEAERQAAAQAKEVTQRAIRRLDLLEWAIFGIGALLAMGGGAVVAGLLAVAGGWDFRSTWIGASLLLFVVPGVAALVKIRRDERSGPGVGPNVQRRDDG